MNKDEQRWLATAAPFEEFHHTLSTPKRRISGNTFNKESDDNTAAARTSPRVSPDTRKGLVKEQSLNPVFYVFDDNTWVISPCTLSIIARFASARWPRWTRQDRRTEA
jgi:hypothetical protein